MSTQEKLRRAMMTGPNRWAEATINGKLVSYYEIHDETILLDLIDTATREAIRLTWLESAEGWNNEYWGQELSEEEVIQEVTKTILAQLQEQSGGSDE